jgi:O-antigen ligase
MNKLIAAPMESERLPIHSLPWLLSTIFLILFLGAAIAVIVSKLGVFALLAIPALLLLLAILVNVEIGVFVFIFVIYIHLSQVLIVNYNFPSTLKPLVVLMFFTIIVRRIMLKDQYQGWLTPAILMGIYAFLGVISLLYADSIDAAVTTLIEYLKDAVIGIILIVLTQRPSSLRVAIWSLLSAGIFLGSISVFQRLTNTYDNNYWGFAIARENTTYGDRVAGPLGDPNFFGQIMVILIPLAIERVWNEKKVLMKALAGWAFFVCTLTVIFTYSRGAFLAMITSLFLVSVLRRPRITSVLLGLGAFAILIQFVPVSYQDRIMSLLNILPSSRTGGYVDQSVQGRLSENLVGRSIFWDHPVWGVGIGNYNIYYQDYARKLGLEWRNQERSSHNLYLELLAERGMVGMIVFGGIVFLTLRQLIRARAQFRRLKASAMAELTAAVGISLITYLVTAIFLHDAYPRFFWIVVGLAWTVSQSAEYIYRLNKAGAVVR